MQLTPSELNHLRTDLDKWKVDVCDIYRNDEISDSYGGKGSDGTPTKVYSNVPCHIAYGIRHFQALSMEGLERFRREVLIRIPDSYTVLLNDHIVLTTADQQPANMHLRVQALLGSVTYGLDSLIVCNIMGESVVTDAIGEGI